MARVTCLRVSFWPRPIAYPSGSAHCSLRAARRGSDPASTLTRTRLERTLRHARSLLPFSRSSPEDFALSGDRGVSICTRTVSVTAHCGPTRQPPRPTPLRAQSGIWVHSVCVSEYSRMSGGCGLRRHPQRHSPYLHFYVYSIKVKGREIYHMYTPEHRTDDERVSRHGRQTSGAPKQAQSGDPLSLPRTPLFGSRPLDSLRAARVCRVAWGALPPLPPQGMPRIFVLST